VLPIVNAAYAAGEAGLWHPGVERIGADELREVIERHRLAVARRGGEIVGCVRIGDDWFGLLAVAAAEAGTGVGRALVAFAEETCRARGAPAMRLNLLVPRTGSHPFKRRLDAWYSRLGYRVVGRGEADFEGLAVPCELLFYEKPL
jgi:GNAT superfamily N-acetyltransferase